MKPIKPIWQSVIVVIIIIIVGAIALCVVSSALADLTPTEARANLQAAVNQIAAEQAAKAKRARQVAEHKAKVEQQAAEREERRQAVQADREAAQNSLAEAERRRVQEAAWIAAEPERRRREAEQKASIEAWRAQLVHTPNIIIVHREGKVMLSVNGRWRECASQAEAENLATQVRQSFLTQQEAVK